MSVTSKGITALLVDDDPSDLKLYARIISRAGYATMTALVSGTGVSFPRGIKPDVAIMDYRYKSQLEAPDIQQLLKLKYPDIPIMLMSEIGRLPGDMRGLVDAFVAKGAPDTLLKVIERLCGPPKPKTRRDAA